MLNDDDGHDDDSKDGRHAMVPMLALDPVNLQELMLWGKLAKKYLMDHRVEAQGFVGELVKGAVQDSELEFTKLRLDGFLSALGELIGDLRLAQATEERSTLDPSKLH